MASVSEARQQLQVRRQEATEAQEQLQKVESSLPSTSTQKALRSNLSGMQGRIKRQQIESAKGQIEEQKGVVADYLTQLQGYEQQIIQAEAEQQAQQSSIDEERNAYAVAYKLYTKNIPPSAEKGKVREYLKKFYINESVAKQALQKNVQEFEAQNPTEKLYVDWNALKVTGVKSGTFMASLPIDEYNKRIDEMNRNYLPPVERQSIVQPSSDINLSNKDIPIIDGLSSTNRTLPVVNLSVSSPQQPDNTNRSWINRVIDTFKGDIKKDKETYSPELGGFVSASPTGERGTAYIRPPTIAEREQIDKYKAPVVGIINSGYNALKVGEQDIGRRIIDPVYNTFKTGTEDIGVKVIDPTYKTFLVGVKDIDKVAGKKVIDPVYNTLRAGEGKAYKAVVKPTYETFVVGAEDIALRIGKQVQKSPVVYNKVEEYFGEQGKLNVLYVGANVLPTTGSFVERKAIESGVNPEIARGVRYATETGGYFIPVVGNWLFVASAEEKLKKEGYNPIKYAKENPVEALTLGGIGLFKVGKFGANKLKLTKEAKYLSQEEGRIIERMPQTVENTYKEGNKVPKLDVLRTEEEMNLKLIPKKKGVTTITEGYTPEVVTEKVTEFRKTSLFGKPKAYSGERTIGDEFFKEVIDYGNVKKVTNIGKEGRGTVELFDKQGNLILSRKVKGDFSSINLRPIRRPKVNEVVIDENFPNTNKVMEVNGRKYIKNAEGERVIDVFNPNAEPNLESARIKAKFTAKTSQARDLEQGVFRITTEKSAVADVINAGARKGEIKVSKGGKNFKAQARQGQTIEYGIPKDIDVSTFTNAKGMKLGTKTVSPSINRQIAQVEETGFLEVQINPKSKYIKQLKKIEQAKANEFLARIESVNEEKILELKSNIKEVKSKLKPRVSKDEALPSYVGGEGGEASQSVIALNKDLVNIPEEITVLPTEVYLKGGKPNIRNAPSISLSKSSSIPLIRKTEFGEVSLVSDVNIESTRQSFLPSVKSESKLDIIETQKPSEGTKFKNQFREILDQPQKTEQTQIFKQPQKLSSLNVLKQMQKLNQEQKQRQNQKQKPKPTKIKSPPFKIKIGEVNESGKKVSKEEFIKMFEVFARKKGVDVLIGEAPTRARVKDILRSELKGTLRASGFAKEKGTGRVLSFEEIDLGAGFARSKVEPFRIVQKRSNRLGSGGERTEIKTARKSKGRKVKWFS